MATFDDLLEEDLVNHAGKSPYRGMSLEEYQQEIQGHQERKKKTTAEIYQGMKDRVKGMTLSEKLGTAAANETADLWSGIKDAGDVTKGIIGDVIGSDRMFDESVTDVHNREIQHEAVKEGRRAFEEDVPWYVRGAGAMLPYMVDSALLGPRFVKGAAKGIDLAAEGLKASATKVGEGGKTLIQLASELPGAWGKPGQYIQKEITQPIAKEVARFKKQVPITNPWMAGVPSSILGNSALGGLESAIHPDQDFQEGVIASTLGTIGGEAIKPYFHRAPNFYNESEKKLVDWAKEQGYRLLPGAETGHRGMQMFEGQLRNAETWTDAINQIDRGNEYITNRLVFDQLGFPGAKDLKAVTPEVLRSHMDNLKADYNDLLSKTQMRIEPGDISDLRRSIAPLDPNIPAQKKVIKLLTPYIDSLEKVRRTQKVARDPLTGRLVKTAASSSDYKNLRDTVSSDIKQAYDSKNSLLASHLETFLKKLDVGIERGAREYGGEAGVAEWKDLNERWSLSNLIMEEGMKPNGMVDMEKLGRHFMSDNPKRYLMETAEPRLTEIQKAAKFADMTKNYANGGLFNESGQFLKNPQSKSAFQRFIGTTPAAWVPGLRNAYMDLYSRGYPSQYGLLGFNGKGLANIPLYTRSFQQATQAYPEILKEAKKKYDEYTDMSKKAGETVNKVTGSFEDLLGD